jgi:hypothetical protein
MENCDKSQDSQPICSVDIVDDVLISSVIIRVAVSAPQSLTSKPNTDLMNPLTV